MLDVCNFRTRSKTYLVPHPLFCLCAQNTFLAFGVALRDHVLAKVVADVLDDRLTFRDNNVFFRASRPDSDGRRLSKGMYGLQFRACTLVLISLVHLDAVFEVQLFEQPYDALAT